MSRDARKRVGVARPRTARDTARRARRAGPAWHAWILPIALVVVAAVAGAAFWARSRPPVTLESRGVRDIAARFDAAVTQGDWRNAVRWGERLTAKLPRNEGLISGLAGAWHNYATIGSGDGSTRRPALRNSLDRWECEQRALRTADQAAACAQDGAQRADARFRHATYLDLAGFHGDALEEYLAILRQDPRHVMAASRVVGIRARLRNPAYGDTVSGAEIDSLLAAQR